MKKRNIVETEIEQLFGKTVCNQKMHEKQADIYHTLKVFMEIIRIGCSIAATAGIFAIVMRLSFYLLWESTAAASLISTGVNLYLSRVNFDSLERAHKKCATDWTALREAYTLLISEMRADLLTDDEILGRKNGLFDEFQFLTKTGPFTTKKARSRANRALRIKNNVISAEKINEFLAPEIRREVEPVKEKA